jgi:hypothetical protein
LDKDEFGPTQLLGKNKDYYLFLCQDDNGVEYILSYDMGLIFNKRRVVEKNEFTTEILHDQEFLTLHPSGVMFSYSSDLVFQMRIKDNRVIISELKE